MESVKLYLLFDKEWRALTASIEKNCTSTLKDLVTILKIYSPPFSDDYAIISLSDKADAIIEEYGATIATEKNYIRHSFCTMQLLYGNKGNIEYVSKVR